MKICSLASGSSGNCIYISSKDTHILIDAGLSGKKVKEGLSALDVPIEEIQAILITHEHSDHIKGLGVLSRKYHIPIHTKSNTFEAIMNKSSLGVINPSLFTPVIEDEPFFIGDIQVTAFKSFHDAVDPIGYTFISEGKKISVATDLGTYNDYIKTHLANSNLLFIEANHDIRMLEVGSYPFFLKQRILSDLGHLSNERSAQLICELYHQGMSHIVLGHLSEENNMPDVAYASVEYELKNTLKHLSENIKIIVANRCSNSELICL